MAENTTPRTCPKDCRLCGFQQHAFCAAQMALSSFPMLDTIVARLEGLETAVRELKGAADLATPIVEKKHKKDGGADNRPSETLKTE